MNGGAHIFPEEVTYPGTGVNCRRARLPGYDIDVIPGDDVVFVTFFAADIDSRHKLPWGASFLRRSGHTVVGIKGQGQDWYRGRDLHQFIRSEAFRSFLAGYRKVVFYGASKGGFGALAFSEVVEKPIVLAISPQVSLDLSIVPFEHRYLAGQAQDWSGDFRNAIDSLRDDGDYHVLLDPLESNDVMHLKLLLSARKGRFTVGKLPLAGHALPERLVAMGKLGEIVRRVRDQDADEAFYARIMRGRRTQFWYFAAIAMRSRVPLPVRRMASRRASEIAPASGDARLAKAYLARDEGRADEAIEQLRGIAADFPKLAARCKKSITEIETSRDVDALLQGPSSLPSVSEHLPTRLNAVTDDGMLQEGGSATVSSRPDRLAGVPDLQGPDLV